MLQRIFSFFKHRNLFQEKAGNVYFIIQMLRKSFSNTDSCLTRDALNNSNIETSGIGLYDLILLSFCLFIAILCFAFLLASSLFPSPGLFLQLRQVIFFAFSFTLDGQTFPKSFNYCILQISFCSPAQVSGSPSIDTA